MNESRTRRRQAPDVATPFGAPRPARHARQATIETRDSEQRLHDLIESLDAIVWEADPDTFEFSFVSGHAETILGYPISQWLSEPAFLLNHIHADDVEMVRERYAAVMAVGGPFSHRCDYRVVAADGRAVWMEGVCRVTRDASGRPRRLSGVLLDITDRKAVERHLRLSEQRHQALVDAESECVGVVAHDHTLVSINRAGLAMVEADSLAQVGGQPVLPLIADQDRAAFADLTARVCRGAEDFLEFDIVGLKGTHRTLETHAVPLRNERGEPIAALGITRDITERKHVERALRTRAHQQAVLADFGQRALGLSDLTALMNEAVVLIAQTLAVEYCKVLELLSDGSRMRLVAGVGWHDGLIGRATVGVDRESQAGYTLMTDAPVVVEDLRSETRFSGPQLLREHGVVSGISVVIRGSAERYGVLGAHTTQRRSFSPDDVHFTQTMANIVAQSIQRHHATAALRESEERYRRLFETAPDAVMLCDGELELVAVNPSGVALFGYDSAEEMIGKDVREFYAPENRGATAAAKERLLRVGAMKGLERVGLKKDGTRLPLEGSAALILDADRKPKAIIGMLRDVSERKQAEREIHRLNTELERRVAERTAELEAANEELEAFSYSVSHDLRAPLRSIGGFGRALAEDCAAQIDAQGLHYLARIRAGAERMDQQIDAMLSLSHVTRCELHRESIDLSALAERVAAELRATQPERIVEFVVHPGLVADADARLMRVLLENLLGNAWKYTRKHVTARIEFGSLADGVWPMAKDRTQAGQDGGDQVPSAISESSSFATTAPASTWATSIGCSAPSSVCTALTSSRAAASAWSRCSASCAATAARCGPKARSNAARPSRSHWEQPSTARPTSRRNEPGPTTNAQSQAGPRSQARIARGHCHLTGIAAAI
ncbi:MAG: PAS domain S-box protein [Deltaproteobacteria bacterium]|nr:PAS domain S-box protein [Deltaproteobacteria bacterium]MBI3389605.1 PAS domain S-box protein [Deltaproteobacteria bacterium]